MATISIGPTRCANLTGLPQLTYPNTCGVPIYQHWNATQDPYTTLGECCREVNGTIGYFGEESCAAYCNATESTRGQLHDCLAHSREINQFGCSGAVSTKGEFVERCSGDGVDLAGFYTLVLDQGCAWF